MTLLKNSVMLIERKGHSQIQMDGGNPAVSFQ